MQLLLKSVDRRPAGSRRRIGGCPAPAVTADVLESRQMLSAVTVQVPASQDTTLYSEQAEDANGAGQFLLTGTAGEGDPGKHLLVEFDLEGLQIPSGATIIDAVLTLNLVESLGPSVAVSVHQITTAWGESGSDAVGTEVFGASAEQFDATWIYAFFDGSLWGNPGGDYVGSASATTEVDQPGIYQWFGGGLISDVQQWLDDPETNHGWALVGAGEESLKTFTSREGGNAVLQPLLEITYELPQTPGLVQGRIWHDVNADGARVPAALADLGLEFSGGRTFYNLYGGNEYWLRSAETRAWYFFRDNGQLTQWSGQPRSLTGTVAATLDPRVYYTMSVLTEPSEAEPWLNGFTVQLLNSAGTVLATDVTHSIDINHDGTIDPENEDGWYRFENLPEGNYQVRPVPPESWRITGEWNGPVGELAIELQGSLGLRFSNSLYENVGGRGERWVRGDSGWYYLTPDGSLYEWDRQTISVESPVTGQQIAVFGSEYHRNPSLLFDPLTSSVTVSVLQQNVLLRVDYGIYQPIQISGRHWFDFDSDGQRDPGTSATDGGLVANISGPFDLSGSGGSWFYDKATDDWYVVTADGVVELWTGTTPNGGSGSAAASVPGGGPGSGPGGGGPGGDPGGTGSGGSDPFPLDAEPWLNGWTVELLDQQGFVVRSAVTGDRDQNQNGATDIETERGWYGFQDVIPGQYTVRFVEPAGWVSTNIASAADVAKVVQMAQQPFQRTKTDFFNWGGRSERWLKSGDTWYFIVPDGRLFRYQTGTGGAGGGLQGTEVADLSSSFYVNLDLLVNPASNAVKASSGDGPIRLDFGSHRVLDGAFADIADLLLL